jgi:hypothetical protein
MIAIMDNIQMGPSCGRAQNDSRNLELDHESVGPYATNAPPSLSIGKDGGKILKASLEIEPLQTYPQFGELKISLHCIESNLRL